MTFVLPDSLRELAGGRAFVELDGAPGTVREALRRLRADHPAVHDRLVTERGELRPHVNLFVGTEDIRYTGGLDTLIGAAARVTVLRAVSGG